MPKARTIGRRHAVLGLVDAEVLERALCLGAPVAVRGDLDVAKGIALGSGAGGSHGADGGEAGDWDEAGADREESVPGGLAKERGERAGSAGRYEGGGGLRMCPPW